MKKDQIYNVIQSAPKELKNEIDYFINQYFYDPDYTLLDAFNDALMLAEDNNDKVIFNQCKPILINMGYCEPIDITKVFSTGKKYWFKYNGIYYDVVCSWEKFINSL